MSPQALQDWAARYRLAARELLAQKRQELRGLDDDEAARRTDLLVAASRTAWVDPQRQTSSGLVEQQRIFRRLGSMHGALG